MLSGDKEKVKEYADKMSYYELQEAMNKVDLMAKLNRVPPEPTTMDKIDAAMKKVDTARDWMDKGLRAYDALAAINNTFNKEHQWPRAEFGGNKNDNKNDKNKFENVAKKIVTDAQNAHAQNEERDNKQSRSEKKAEARAERKAERAEEKKQERDNKKAERAAEKEEERANKKAEREAKKNEDQDKEDEIERVRGKVVTPEMDPFRTDGAFDADYRDLNMDSPYSTGEEYLNRYLLEDKRR
jgi:chemotaxis protein histidine kinase CheA